MPTLRPEPHALPTRPQLPPSLIERHAANYSPGDGNAPGAGGAPFAPGAPGGGGFDPNEGNFKKGSTKPIIIVLGLAVVIGAVGLGIMAAKSEGEKVTVDGVVQERKNIYMLPKAEQLPKWRAWARRDDVPSLQQDAFANLAWARDEEGLKLIIEKGLGSSDHRVRGQAATALYDYGSPKADAAKPRLLEVLKEADSTDKPQITWALAVLKEASAFDAVLAEYRTGHLGSIQKLDGSPAFDPDVLAGMVPLDKLASYAGDESESVRQLTATILSRTADDKWTDVLIKLVVDKSVEVAREAAVGLGRIANEKAISPLLQALDKANKDSRQRFLEALRDGVGGNGLVLALKSIQKGHEAFQIKQLFDMMKELQDPRSADTLVKYIESNPHPHWKTEAALRLAEIGDARAVPYLAWRLQQDPMKLYSDKEDDLFARLRLDDNERVVAARMIADLAILHPDKRDVIRAQAEDAVLAWALEHPQPHANAMRFLAVVNSPKAAPKLRKWADPTDPLPKEGQQPPMPDSFATAQSALRYVGWSHDPEGWSILTKQLTRRPPKVDVTMESLQQGGLAILGMTVRGLGVGASDGFAEWGDPKAFPLLMKYIEDPMDNEQGRYQGCFALSWVATDDNMKEVAKKVHDYNKPDPKSQLVRGCLLETMIHRPVPAAAASLVDLITAQADTQVRHQAARAIGFGGVDGAVKAKLMDMLKDDQLRADAMLALLIGADPDTVQQGLARYNGSGPEAMEELKDIYNRSFGYWSDRNYQSGDIARWIINAESCRYVKVNDALQDWPRMILQRAVQGIEFNNGPHSMTLVQFRTGLLRDAKGADAKKRTDAVAILKFMREKGSLMALRNEPGDVGELARKAFFEVMNPKMVEQKIPDAASDKAGTAKP